MPWTARAKELASLMRLCQTCGIDIAVDEKNIPLIDDGTIDVVVCALCSVEKLLAADQADIAVMAGGKRMTIQEAVAKLRADGLIP